MKAGEDVMASANQPQVGQSNHPASPARSRKIRCPLRIIYPEKARVVVIGGQWRRLPDRRIECRYDNDRELALSVTLSVWLKEWETEPPPVAPLRGTQLVLFEREQHNYQA